jgi:hopanoid biosynthesis associated protein HpnK
VTRDRFLVITADDFGVHEAVNEAVEQACQAGVLTAASLMMGAAATDDAVERARRLPMLRVGLHLVLADGLAVLPPKEIASLVDEQGRFGNRMPVEGIRYFFLPRVRKQLEAEIRAQFRAFAATGLALDHVNAHKHFHVHPTLLTLMLRIGREFGLRAMRVPYEPASALSTPGSAAGRMAAASLRPWLALMRHRLRRAGIVHNDLLFGISDSGALGEARLLALLERVPRGVTEIYLHPGTCAGEDIAPSMRGYRHTEELAALLSPRVRALLSQLRIQRGGYGDL